MGKILASILYVLSLVLLLSSSVQAQKKEGDEWSLDW